jgi:DNA-binding transcriptional ArsR family regulator
MEKQLVISALSALAQETRLDIFRLLVEAGPCGLPAGALAEALGTPSATLSFHLKEPTSATTAARAAVAERSPSGRDPGYRRSAMTTSAGSAYGATCRW